MKVGPIFDQLRRKWNGDQIVFHRYVVPANHQGGQIIEDLIEKGFIQTREEKSLISGAVSTVADLGCLGATGSICVYDGVSQEFIMPITSSYSYDEAEAKIYSLLTEPARKAMAQADGGGEHGLARFSD